MITHLLNTHGSTQDNLLIYVIVLLLPLTIIAALYVPKAIKTITTMLWLYRKYRSGNIIVDENRGKEIA